MTITQISHYKDQLAGLPEEAFIGSLLWYSISGTVDYIEGKRTQIPVRVTRDQLEAWFHELGLDSDFLPPKILKVDAFRKASTEAKRVYDIPGSDGLKAELYIDEVESNNEYVLRHIMRKVRDPRQQTDEAKLTTEYMATLKFFRGGRTAKAKRSAGDHYKSRPRPGLNSLDLEHVESMLSEIDDRYTDLSANLNEDKIRAVVRNYLTHLNAIGVKPSGAVYFVHKSRQRTLDALEDLVGRIGQGCTMDQVPLIDDVKRRNMLTEAFQAEVEDDVRVLLGKVAEANAKAKSGKVSPKLYAELNAKYQEVQSRSEEYTRVLGLAMGRAASSLELALDSVMDLATRIDFKGAAK